MTLTTRNYRMRKEKIFEEEMMPHLETLFMYAYNSFTRNEEDANDLVQDTMLKAYNSIDSYQEGTNAKAWLFKILYNTYINNYRRKKKRPNEVDFEKVKGLNNDESSDYSSVVTIDEDLFGSMIGDEVSMAMDQLSEEARNVILLSDIMDFKYEEIAALLDIPIGTVRSRLFRARNTLKEILKDYGDSIGIKNKRK
ncbi:MAG: sigma-70 family RNA polymerase sigma factor [Lewinellaceae bacterium]|nr:sigma-70 family RNA polymerase sigma factor [Lewinellaceae bacterium]